MHHAFLHVSLPSLHNYNMKWPNFEWTWEWEWQGDKFFFLSLNSETVPSLQFHYNLTSLLSSNWVTWYKGEKVLKDTKSIFQQRFHWHRHCQNVRSLSRSSCNHNDDGKEEAKKNDNFYKKNKTLHVQHIFHTSFSWQCMASTWNCLISLRT